MDQSEPDARERSVRELRAELGRMLGQDVTHTPSAPPPSRRGLQDVAGSDGDLGRAIEAIAADLQALRSAVESLDRMLRAEVERSRGERELFADAIAQLRKPKRKPPVTT